MFAKGNQPVIRLITLDKGHVEITRALQRVFDPEKLLKLETRSVGNTKKTSQAKLISSTLKVFQQANQDLAMGKNIDGIVCQVTLKKELRELETETGLKLDVKDLSKQKNVILEFIKKNKQLSKLNELIEEINKASKNGVKVYLSGGNSLDEVMQKFRKSSCDLNSSYYDFISNGKDTAMEYFFESRFNPRFYKFNLLNLSEGISVGIKNPHVTSEFKQYPISAMDDTIKRFEDGTFNAFPVRNKDGKIKGYNLADDSNKVHLKGDWGNNDGFIKYLENFIGKNIKQTQATQNEHKKLKPILDKISENRLKGKENNLYGLTKKELSFLKTMANKLFKIDEVMDELVIKPNIEYKKSYKLPNNDEELWLEEIRKMGNYSNCYGDNFFDINKEGKVYSKKFDCEGTHRPSVENVHGTCMAAAVAAYKDALEGLKMN